MKVRITLKDPDGVYESVKDAARKSIEEVEGLNKEEREVLLDTRIERILAGIRPFVECSEYVTIEIDIDGESAEVLRT